MESADIWLRLVQLTTALETDALTREERVQAAVRQYQQLPPTVRKQLLSQLQMLALDLFELLPAVVAAEDAMPTKKSKSLEAG